MRALANRSGRRSSLGLFRAFLRDLLRGADRAERIRHGFGSEVDGLMTIPDQARLDALLDKGGVFIGLPHLHASMVVGRELANRYEVLSLVRLSKNASRAAAQIKLYENVGCELLEVRDAEPTAAARAILKALKAGKIVLTTVDRIHAEPEGEYDRARDVVRTNVFDTQIGVSGWPVRFSAKAGAPMLIGLSPQTSQDVTLVLSDTVIPDDDLVASTQAWMNQLTRMVTENPQEWAFSLDKHRARALQVE